MGQAKQKRLQGFSAALIEEWEAEDCINFAVAVARISGWLLHVDWLSESINHDEDVPVTQMRPMRVYAADNGNLVFDVRGIKTIREFNETIIQRIARRMATTPWAGCRTKYYGEDALGALPLRHKPDETKIARAIDAIVANPPFVNQLRTRQAPFIPAAIAASFSYGGCAVYAEALEERTGLRAVAMLADRFVPEFEATTRGEDGYFHTVVLRPDGLGEDAWGVAPLDEIAARFGVIEYRTSESSNAKVLARLKLNSPDQFAALRKRAIEAIGSHRAA